MEHDLEQGTPEWFAHRAEHDNASDAPAMLGISPYKTRNELLAEQKSCITVSVDAATQKRFDEGHRIEALARPLAEKVIGRKLYPCVVSEGKLSASLDARTLSASLDGRTADDEIIWEHKSLNDEIRGVSFGDDLPEIYRVQMEQQLMCSPNSKRVLFTATKWEGEVCVESIERFYITDAALRARIIAGWEQFHKDLETFVPKVTKDAPKADLSIELPALFIQAHGEIIASNMEAYGEALKNKLIEVRAIKLVTDQDFSNAKEAAKLFREQYKKINLSKEAMLAQTTTIGEAARMMDLWAEDLRVTALKLEKDVEVEDLAKKRAMVAEAANEYKEHIDALNESLNPIVLQIIAPDFQSAIKGKRNYSSMQSALDDALSLAKSTASSIAQDIVTKQLWFNKYEEFDFLFRDKQTLFYKHQDDFQLAVTSRIADHQKAEADKQELQREEIRKQEEAKAIAKVQAEEKEHIAAEVKAQVKAQMEAQAKALAETTAKAISQVIPIHRLVGEIQNQGTVGVTVELSDHTELLQTKVVTNGDMLLAEVNEAISELPSADEIIALLQDIFDLTEFQAITAIHLASKEKQEVPA